MAVTVCVKSSFCLIEMILNSIRRKLGPFSIEYTYSQTQNRAAGAKLEEEVSDTTRYSFLRKLGFSIDAVEDGFGAGSKWKWSFVELEGRFAVIAKNLLNLRTFVAKLDPRIDGYNDRTSHLSLCKELLQNAADRYREKYELSTLRLDDMKQAISYLGALKRLHAILGEDEGMDVVNKKIDAWKIKLESDERKQKEKARRR